jgi:hypothetical protein
MPARIRHDDAEDAFEQHRFSGARSADHHDRFAWHDVEIEVAQDMMRAERLVQAANPDLRCRIDRNETHRAKNNSVIR